MGVTATLLWVAGCGGVTSTNGVSFARTAGNAAQNAAAESASHDIQCPEHDLRIVGEFAGNSSLLVIVQGCGERLTYAECSTSAGLQMVLIARMRLK